MIRRFTTRGAGRSNHTSLRTPWDRHKCRVVTVVVALALAGGLAPLGAQAPENRPVMSTAQAFSFAGAGILLGTSMILDANAGPPSCAPCDPATLPWFDRWAVGVPNRTVSRTSDVLILGLAGTTMWDTWRTDGGDRRAVITLEGVAWTMALTEIAKIIIGRERPVMYTDQAVDAATSVTNQRSMWSGHTSTAFALAAGYWVNNPDRGVGPKLVAVLSAAGVGALRVAAAKHFPSDVVVGAVVGTATALLMHEIRF